jgi:hypothetical protein
MCTRRRVKFNTTFRVLFLLFARCCILHIALRGVSVNEFFYYYYYYCTWLTISSLFKPRLPSGNAKRYAVYNDYISEYVHVE